MGGAPLLKATGWSRSAEAGKNPASGSRHRNPRRGLTAEKSKKLQNNAHNNTGISVKARLALAIRESSAVAAIFSMFGVLDVIFKINDTYSCVSRLVSLMS